MSRYRPPTPPGSKYITPEGAKRLRDELHELWHDERPRVTAAVAEAAAQGDRSENAEYTYGKKRLHEIDRRVRFLRKRLEGMTIVDIDVRARRGAIRSASTSARGCSSRQSRRRAALVPAGRARRIRHGERLRQHGLAAGSQPARQAPGRRDHGGAAGRARRPSRWSRSATRSDATARLNDPNVLELPGIRRCRGPRQTARRADRAASSRCTRRPPCRGTACRFSSGRS